MRKGLLLWARVASWPPVITGGVLMAEIVWLASDSHQDWQVLAWGLVLYYQVRRDCCSAALAWRPQEQD